MTYLDPNERRLHETRGKNRKRWRVWLPRLLKITMLLVSFVGAVLRFASDIKRMFGD